MISSHHLHEDLSRFGAISRSHPDARATVVLFHGLTGTPEEMRGLGDLLYAAGYSVQIPLLAGHGATIEEMRVTTAATFIESARQELTKIDLTGGNVVLVGLSFGALLALLLAAENPDRVRGAVLLSPPLLIRPRIREWVLRMLSYAPEAILNRLPLAEKAKRSATLFKIPRVCFGVHSIGAAARVVSVRVAALCAARRAAARCCPLLVAQDPADHHLDPRGIKDFEVLAGMCQIRASVRWYQGGEHELTLGSRSEEVLADTVKFIRGLW